jgi:hypothetical protein
VVCDKKHLKINLKFRFANIFSEQIFGSSALLAQKIYVSETFKVSET